MNKRFFAAASLLKQIALLVCFSFAWGLCAERLVLPDEVAYYPMQEGQGNVVHEAEGRQEDGKILRSFWTTNEGISVVDFGGMKNSRQACIDFPAFAFDKEFSIAFWVSAYWWKENWAPFFYRGDKSYGVRNNQNNPGQICFLVRDPEQKRVSSVMSNTILLPRCWYHVAVTFKPGKFMRIYLNGVLDAEKIQSVPKSVAQDDNRCRVGGIVKPGKNSTDFFTGVMANLHLFSRALSPEEVAQLRSSENRFDTQTGMENTYPADGKVVASLGKTVELFDSGALRIRNGKGGIFRLDSSYSYPQEPLMGFNSFTAAPIDGMESVWKPEFTAEADNKLVVKASGSKIGITREITILEDRRIRVRETLQNLTDQDQAVLFQHQITPSIAIEEWAIGGEENVLSTSDDRIFPSNPTGFMMNAQQGGLAWVAEDDIFRCHLSITVQDAKDAHRIFKFGSRKIGVPAGKSHTLEYTVYPLEGGDYFDFINRLRADWNIPQVTMAGPFGLIRTAAQSTDEYKRFAAGPEEFRKVLERKKMNIITLNPWFNYWDGAVFHTRSEFKENMQKAMKIIRAANPDAKFLASLETYVYCIGEADFEGIPEPEGFSWDWKKNTDGTQARLLKTPWKDSFTCDASGRVILYPESPVPVKKGERSPRVAIPTMVYPEVGNQFFKTRLEEYDFLINEVGFDGIYQDMFGFSNPGSIIPNRWDGFSVSIQPDGTIGRKYAHQGPLSSPARAIWIRKILDMKKIALTNFGAPTTREMQTLPYLNFCEAAGRNLGRQNLDAIPPYATGCVMNHLSTPLAYGPHKDEETDGPRLMKRIRAYLRHGCLYVHTSFRNRFPESGPKSADYAPVNHMFPMTVQELHRGWVKGNERIVSCVSYTTTWNRKEKPVALRFDELGRSVELEDAAVIAGEPGNWKITVKINDWNEFLILE